MAVSPISDRYRWHASPAFSPAHPLWHWLRERSSLTARVAARCQRLDVRLLTQKLAVPVHDEARLLGLRPGERAWVREILLEADGVPVVYARSVLPRRSLRGAWMMFAGMGTRPLGAALFADPRVRRGPLRMRALDAREPRYHRAAQAAGLPQPARLWARRSLFLRQGRALLVCEVFLRGILELEGSER